MTEKIYLDNPYLREIEGRIIEKEYINNKYHLKLNRTIFYPNLAGGQPGDKGTINGLEVIEVYKDNDAIIHVVGENIYSDKVSLSIDWDNRLDYMQQHTGQHILSAAFYKIYSGETVGFYIGKKLSYIDINLKNISQDFLNKVEDFANRIVFSNFSIKTYIMAKKNLNNLKKIEKPKNNLNIRIMEIEGIDFSPSEGTHNRNTGEVGLIKILNTEDLGNNTRVNFLCGNRSLRDYRRKNTLLEDIESTLEENTYLKEKNRILKEKIALLKSREFLEKTDEIDGINYLYRELDSKEFTSLGPIVSILNKEENLVQIYTNIEEGICRFLFSASKNLNINLEGILKEISSNIDLEFWRKNLYIEGRCSEDFLDNIISSFYNSI